MRPRVLDFDEEIHPWPDGTRLASNLALIAVRGLSVTANRHPAYMCVSGSGADSWWIRFIVFQRPLLNRIKNTKPSTVT